MSEQESEAAVVSLAERRAQNQRAEAAAAKQRARSQPPVDLSTLPKPWVTYLLIGLNVVMWVAMVGAGVDAYEPKGTVLREWGGNLGLLTTQGQWWRLLSATFIHAGIAHVALNMMFLWMVGRICEQIYGAAAFALIYFGGGILASLASTAWQPAIVSVGASGAVFGVFGAFVAFTVRRRALLQADYVRSVQRNALILLGVNLAIGIAVPGIDLVAHIAGLATGFGLGYLLAALGERPAADLRAAKKIRAQAVAIAGTVVAAILAAGVLALPRYDNPFPVLEATGARYDAAIGAYRETENDNAARIEILEREVIPTMEDNLAKLNELGVLPEMAETEVERLSRYYELCRQAFARELEGLRTNDPVALAEAEDIYAEALTVLQAE